MKNGKLIYCPVSDDSISFFAHEVLFFDQTGDENIRVFLAVPTADVDGPSVFVDFAITSDTESTVMKNIAHAIFSPSSSDGAFVDLSSIEGVGAISTPNVDVTL